MKVQKVYLVFTARFRIFLSISTSDGVLPLKTHKDRQRGQNGVLEKLDPLNFGRIKTDEKLSTVLPPRQSHQYTSFEVFKIGSRTCFVVH